MIYASPKNRLIVALFFFGFLHGSGFYLLHRALRPSFVIGPLLILALPMLAFHRYRDRDHLTLLLATLGFVAVALFYLGFAHDQLQLVDFFYLSALPCTLVAAQLAAEESMRSSGVFLLKIISACTVFIIFGLLVEMLTGVRLVESDIDFVFASIFNNPNDLATVVICYMPLTAYLLKSSNTKLLGYGMFLILSVGLLLISMSRLALVILALLFMVQALFLIRKSGIIVRVLLFALVASMAYVLLFVDTEQILLNLTTSSSMTVAENARRLWIFVYNFGGDKSAGSRLDTYFYFFRNLHNALAGYGIKNYAEFFAGSGVMKLADTNPHSFFIEMMLAFGVLGLFFILFVAGTIICAFTHSVRYFPTSAMYLILSAITFAIATNIPSSIFRLPILWFPSFYMLFIVKRQLNYGYACSVTKAYPAQSETTGPLK